jgi:signal transduction histidine kinase
MKIGTKGRLATTTALGTIALLAAMIWWAYTEVEEADRQRRKTSEIARALNDLRLVSFEYILYRPERAQLQEDEAGSRLDRLLASYEVSDPEPREILADLRDRSAATRQIFEELRAAPRLDVGSPAADAEIMRRFEAQLSRKLLILQQETLVDAFRLADFSTERISQAQRRVVMVFLAGLMLIAATTGGAAWIIHRGVLAPIRRLEQATREVAAGNWNFKLDIGGDDEIGEMSRNFDAMTGALKSSFAQIERSNQELAALNKEIEAFSYSVSHDLRAPLRSMDGFSLALMEDYGESLDDEARDYLRRIRAASQRMGRLIDELLGLSRVTRTELAIRPVDLSAMARDIAAALEQQQPGRAVRWEIDDGLVVQADKSLMQIAMQNLLENAWKFTSKTEQPVIRVGRTAHDGQTACFVADNGVGFDMAYADRLFGAFQRLHHESEFAGTGIGLAIVQRIVRRHEGRIWARSQPGRGATFFFTLREQGNERRQQGHPAGGGQPG